MSKDFPTARDILVSSLKGEFCEHPIIEVQLSCKKNDAPAFPGVPAIQLSEDWALHLAVDGIGWACTHIPSGYNLGEYLTLAQALMALGAVIASDLPLHRITSPEAGAQMLRDLPTEGRALRNAFKAIRNMDLVDVE